MTAYQPRIALVPRAGQQRMERYVPASETDIRRTWSAARERLAAAPAAPPPLVTEVSGAEARALMRFFTHPEPTPIMHATSHPRFTRTLPPPVSEAELDAAIAYRTGTRARAIVPAADDVGQPAVAPAPAPVGPIDTPDLLADADGHACYTASESARPPWRRRRPARGLEQLLVYACLLFSASAGLAIAAWAMMALIELAAP